MPYCPLICSPRAGEITAAFAGNSRAKRRFANLNLKVYLL